MNRLKNTRCYLVGAMDRVPDDGIQWRRRIQIDLVELGIHFLDPTDKPINIGREDVRSRRLRGMHKVAGNFDFVRDEMIPIRHVDRRMVHFSDYLIVYLDKANSGFGTIAELTLANEQLKPIIVCQEGGKNLTPDWLFGMIPHEMIFGNWPDLILYLRHVDSAPTFNDRGRWLFFDFHSGPKKSFNCQGTISSRHPTKSFNFVAQCDGVARSFDHQGYYMDELGFPWPENLR